MVFVDSNDKTWCIISENSFLMYDSSYLAVVDNKINSADFNNFKEQFLDIYTNKLFNYD